MINGIDHIGIAVSSLEERIPFYRDVLGLGEPHIEEVPDQLVRVAVFALNAGRLELLEPTSIKSPIAQFIASRGEGLHHIALQTDTVEQSIAAITSKQLRMIDLEPRAGANRTKIAFVHPKTTGGVLLEFCSRPERSEPVE